MTYYARNLLAAICQMLLCVLCMYGFLGGILSPHLFNVYINEPSIRLNSQFFGCHINSICYNHLVYADDTVLLAPSPKGLQMLIDICVAFGIENDIVYNEEKTKCMCQTFCYERFICKYVLSRSSK